MSKKGQMIPADAYPQLAGKSDAAHVARMLRSAVTAVRGQRVVEDQGEPLRAAVHGIVDDLEKAGHNYDLVLASAHEIRGLAETAGLVATGRIADGLCRYFDEVGQLGLAPDPAIVTLHVSAILRATRNGNEISNMSDVVAKELAALVRHKLTDVKTLLRR